MMYCSIDKKYKIQPSDDLNEGLKPQETRVFTDGSKTDTSAGTGVSSEDPKIKMSKLVGDLNTVFQAESMGMKLASEAITAL